MSFLGTQPRTTQVPPHRLTSAIATRAPCSAATRAARTPPEPPPITNRSTSKCVIVHGLYSRTCRSVSRPTLASPGVRRSKPETELVFNNQLYSVGGVDRLALSKGEPR